MLSANTDEVNKLHKQLNSSDDSSEKASLCGKLEKLMTKDAAYYAESVQLLKPEIAKRGND